MTNSNILLLKIYLTKSADERLVPTLADIQQEIMVLYPLSPVGDAYNQ